MEPPGEPLSEHHQPNKNRPRTTLLIAPVSPAEVRREEIGDKRGQSAPLEHNRPPLLITLNTELAGRYWGRDEQASGASAAEPGGEERNDHLFSEEKESQRGSTLA